MRLLRIMSCWDMLQLPSKAVPAIGYISACCAEWKLWVQLLQSARRVEIASPNISNDTRAAFLHYCEVLAETAGLLGMRASQAAAHRAFNECLVLLASPSGCSARRLSQAVGFAEQLLQVFNDEMATIRLLTLDDRHALYFEMAAPFGMAVNDAFPSAAFDISEAAKCRALGRWTASVMHLMRALEVALSTLARHFGVEPGSNWNQTLNQIEVAARQIGQKTHGAAEEQWAAEAATHLRFVKNAWRNHAMHPRATYDEERAVGIFDACNSFMQHLAAKVTEYDL